MTLSGYLAARVTVEALRRAGPKADALEQVLRKLRLDFGGYMVDFAVGENIGSKQVALAVIDRAGLLRY